MEGTMGAGAPEAEQGLGEGGVCSQGERQA